MRIEAHLHLPQCRAGPAPGPTGRSPAARWPGRWSPRSVPPRKSSTPRTASRIAATRSADSVDGSAACTTPTPGRAADRHRAADGVAQRVDRRVQVADRHLQPQRDLARLERVAVPPPRRLLGDPGVAAQHRRPAARPARRPSARPPSSSTASVPGPCRLRWRGMQRRPVRRAGRPRSPPARPTRRAPPDQVVHLQRRPHGPEHPQPAGGAGCTRIVADTSTASAPCDPHSSWLRSGPSGSRMRPALGVAQPPLGVDVADTDELLARACRNGGAAAPPRRRRPPRRSSPRPTAGRAASAARRAPAPPGPPATGVPAPDLDHRLARRPVPHPGEATGVDQHVEPGRRGAPVELGAGAAGHHARGRARPPTA